VVLFNDGSTIEQNTIAYNSAPTTGGIYAITSSSVIAKNIVVYNEGYGIKCAGASAGLSLICNDLWENTRGNYYRCDPGEEDISVDSQFCDASRDDFSLCASSPCVNAPDCGQIGALGVGCGPTGVKETTWGRIKAMFR
jgi:hypothetical protein